MRYFCGGNRRYSDEVTGRAIRDSNPSRDKKYHTSCRAHPVTFSTGTGLLSRELSSRGRDAYRSPPSVVEVKNEWHCTNVLSCPLMVFTEKKIPVLFTVNVVPSFGGSQGMILITHCIASTDAE
jgi:hypothetical protein